MNKKISNDKKKSIMSQLMVGYWTFFFSVRLTCAMCVVYGIPSQQSTYEQFVVCWLRVRRGLLVLCLAANTKQTNTQLSHCYYSVYFKNIRIFHYSFNFKLDSFFFAVVKSYIIIGWQWIFSFKKKQNFSSSK